MTIEEMNLPFQDFQLNEIIDPDAFDANNNEIQVKINEMIAEINSMTKTITEEAPTEDTAKLEVLLNNLAHMVTALTGKSDWKTEPAVTLEGTKEHIDDTDNPHSVTVAQIGAETPIGAQARVDAHTAVAAPHSGHETLVGAQTKVNVHANNTNNPHLTTAGHVGALVDINDVANPGGGVDLIGGTGILITPNDTNKNIVIAATGESLPGPHTHSDDEVIITDVNEHFVAESLGGVLDELFTSVSNGKNDIATAVTGKGIEATGSDTFAELADKIDDIVLGSGNAVRSNVLSGKTFSNDNGTGKIGTMPYRGTVIITPSAINQSIPSGCHSGLGGVYAVTFDKTKVLSGTSIAGTVGTMTNRGAYNITPGINNITIPAGFHSGAGVVYGAAHGSQSYTTPGTYTFTVPIEVCSITFIAVGGGGGAGGTNNHGNSGGGGGGGGVYIKTISVTPGQQISVVVGAGGAGGVKNNLSNGYPGYIGDNTSVENYIAYGGVGGLGATSASVGVGGVGGVGGGLGGNGGDGGAGGNVGVVGIGGASLGIYGKGGSAVIGGNGDAGADGKVDILW